MKWVRSFQILDPDFLTLRAHLWTTVYFSPQNRFRMILLTTLLTGIKENEECAKEFFDGVAQKGLTIEDFQQIDDISLTAGITNFYNSKKKNELNKRAQNALDILLGNGQEYECFWLPRPDNIKNVEKDMTILFINLGLFE
jgi:hypothetical protein